VSGAEQNSSASRAKKTAHLKGTSMPNYTIYGHQGLDTNSQALFLPDASGS
jgi:hypothetical protein